MNGIKKRGVLLVGVIVCLFVACTMTLVVWASHHKRSLPGHLLRRLQGESGVSQAVSDLVDDVKQVPFLIELQEWSIETLSNYNSGAHIVDRTITPNLPIKNVVVSPSAVPQFIRNKWQDEPEVALCLSTNGHAECVLIDWYNYGLLVGPTNYSITNFEWIPYYEMTVQTGVFAVWFDSK